MIVQNNSDKVQYGRDKNNKQHGGQVVPTAKELDKFYTDSGLAARLIDTACDKLGANRQQATFLEPSAGSGAFSSLVPNVLAYDIKPEGDGILEADFLKLAPIWQRDTIAIGNPPFGKRARLAIDFVNRCAASCDAVCFVLPNTFRRYNIQQKLDTDLALIYDETLPEHGSFTFEGADYSLRCVFQIWVRRDGTYWNGNMADLRLTKRPPISHPDFVCWQHNATVESRKYIDEDWQYAFWRQGYKDYTQIFENPRDYDEVRRIAYETNLQLFLVKPLTEEADKIIIGMDREALAMGNLSTPGFGKGEFVAEYERLKREREQC